MTENELGLRRSHALFLFVPALPISGAQEDRTNKPQLCGGKGAWERLNELLLGGVLIYTLAVYIAINASKCLQARLAQI
jgi:hypothetical protein